MPDPKILHTEMDVSLVQKAFFCLHPLFPCLLVPLLSYTYFKWTTNWSLLMPTWEKRLKPWVINEFVKNHILLLHKFSTLILVPIVWEMNRLYLADLLIVLPPSSRLHSESQMGMDPSHCFWSYILTLSIRFQQIYPLRNKQFQVFMNSFLQNLTSYVLRT